MSHTAIPVSDCIQRWLCPASGVYYTLEYIVRLPAIVGPDGNALIPFMLTAMYPYGEDARGYKFMVEMLTPQTLANVMEAITNAEFAKWNT